MVRVVEHNEALIENQFWLVIIDRMLREKYNEIEYLAIQPPLDPSIAEINKTDLDWLLSEHERCEQLEQNMADLRELNDKNMAEQLAQYAELEKQYSHLLEQHQAVISSNAWRWGLRFAKLVHVFLKPFRALRGRK